MPLQIVFIEVYKSPKLILVAALAVFLLSVSGLFKLKILTDGHALIPSQAEEVLEDKQIREQFLIPERLLVVIETEDKDGIFNLGTLSLLMDLSNRIKDVEGVDPDRVTSLSTIMLRPKKIDLSRFPYFIRFNLVQDNISKLREEMMPMRFLHGVLLSNNGDYSFGSNNWTPTATMIVVGLEDRAKAEKAIAGIEKILNDQDGRDNIYITGASMAEIELGNHILQDLALLIPFSVLLMAFIFWLRYRNILAVMLPLTEVLACLVFVFGVMGYAAVPIYLTITVMPVILTAIGISDEVHVLNYYTMLLQQRKKDSSKIEIVKVTMKMMRRRIILTSLTTSVGFLAFLFSPIAPVQYFGLFTAIGIMFCMLWTLIVIPACLVLIPVEAFEKKAVLTFMSNTNWVTNVVRWVGNHKKTMLALGMMILLLCTYFVSRVEVWDSWKSGFSEKQEFRRNLEKTNRLFTGTHRLLASFHTQENILEPVSMAELASFEKYLAENVKLADGGVYSVNSQFAFMNSMIQKEENMKRTGLDWKENKDISDYYEQVLGPEMHNELIDLKANAVVTQVLLKDPNYNMIKELIKIIDSYKKESEGSGIEIHLGGDIALSQAMIKGITRTQVTSVLISLMCILILGMIYYRSFRFAFLTVLAPAFSILMLFALMGLLKIPLGVATSMFASILIGVGVDFSIHLIESYRRNSSADEPIILSFQQLAPAFILDTLVISVAFGLMVFSRIPSNARLGVFIICGYVMCFLVTVFIAPLMLKNRKK